MTCYNVLLRTQRTAISFYELEKNLRHEFTQKKNRIITKALYVGTSQHIFLLHPAVKAQ